MNRALSGSVLIILGLFSLQSLSWARGYSGGSLREEYFMVANGQGVSSPSFWNGLSGENPAGLVNNQRLKLQTGGATFADDSTKSFRNSAEVLVGNGLFGTGFEFSRYNAAPYPLGDGQFNWGLAGRFSSINATFGISGHHPTDSKIANYDVGTLIDLLPGLRMGGMIPDLNHGLHVVVGGFTYSLDSMVDFVIDAALQLQKKEGTAKPGITLRTERVVATAAYGINFVGTDSVFLSSKLTAGLGFKFTDNILVEYEYREMPEHRLGLTLRLN